MNASPSSNNLPDAVDQVAASVVGIVSRRGAAAGVVWRDGVAVTSAAALWRSTRVQVVLPDGEQIDGQVRGVDAGTDLAAIAFDGGPAPVAAPAGETPLRAGDVVFAVGREPSGLVQASFGHLGAVAGEWRSWRGGRIDRLLRLDGGLYPGFAGAPVADAAGHVVGVASPVFSRSHAVVLPASTVDRVLNSLLAHGRVRQGYLGIAAQPVRAQIDGAAVEGLLVSSVAEDGPAAAAGLLVGDVVVSAGGQPVSSIDTLRSRLGADAVGGRIELRVARGGQAVTLTLDVAERPQRSCH